MQSRGFLEHVHGRAHDPSRAHTARGLSILAQENHPRVLDAAVGVYLLQHTRARDHHRPARVPVRLALDELGEVLHRGVVGAGHALLVARVSRGDSHAARTAAAAPGRSADADAPRDAGERRRARGRGRHRAHGAAPRHHAVGHGLRASSSLPPTRGRRRRRCGQSMIIEKNVFITATAAPVSFLAPPPPPSPSPLWATRAPRRVSLGADPC